MGTDARTGFVSAGGDLTAGFVVSQGGPKMVLIRAVGPALQNFGYSGRCVVLRPGRYPSFQSMGLNDRISSVRPVAGNGRIEESRYAPRHN